MLSQAASDLLLDNNRITCNHYDCLLSVNENAVFQAFLSSAIDDQLYFSISLAIRMLVVQISDRESE
jgi:hypothetical protein